MADGVKVEFVKKINFNQKAEDFREEVHDIALLRVNQMEDIVRQNIISNDNIETSTLLNDLESKVNLSPKGHAITLEVASNVSGNPDGHRGYAPIIEYGSYRTRAYHNFEPALDTVAPMVLRDLKKIKL